MTTFLAAEAAVTDIPAVPTGNRPRLHDIDTGIFRADIRTTTQALSRPTRTLPAPREAAEVGVEAEARSEVVGPVTHPDPSRPDSRRPRIAGPRT